MNINCESETRQDSFHGNYIRLGTQFQRYKLSYLTIELSIFHRTFVINFRPSRCSNALCAILVFDGSKIRISAALCRIHFFHLKFAPSWAGIEFWVSDDTPPKNIFWGETARRSHASEKKFPETRLSGALQNMAFWSYRISSYQTLLLALVPPHHAIEVVELNSPAEFKLFKRHTSASKFSAPLLGPIPEKQ